MTVGYGYVYNTWTRHTESEADRYGVRVRLWGDVRARELDRPRWHPPDVMGLIMVLVRKPKWPLSRLTTFELRDYRDYRTRLEAILCDDGISAAERDLYQGRLTEVVKQQRSRLLAEHAGYVRMLDDGGLKQEKDLTIAALLDVAEDPPTRREQLTARLTAIDTEVTRRDAERILPRGSRPEPRGNRSSQWPITADATPHR